MTSPSGRPTVSTFLWFDTGVQEAVELYTSLFPDTKVLETIKYPEYVPGPQGKVMSIEFELQGHRITGFNGGPDHPFTDAISLQVNVDSQEQVDFYWDALTADGGQEIACGWLKDRFGLSWQIVPAKAMAQTCGGSDPEGARRATEAMLSMKKLDIAELEAAYAGR